MSKSNLPEKALHLQNVSSLRYLEHPLNYCIGNKFY